MRYDFKLLQETAWAAGIAGLLFLLTAFVASEGVTDWRTWVVTVGGGAARAAVAVIIASLTKPPSKIEAS